MDLTLKVWRQAGPDAQGEFKSYDANNVSEDASFLEMLDEVNEHLNDIGENPIAFEHDCREGICGMCGGMITGHPHGQAGRHSNVPAPLCASSTTGDSITNQTVAGQLQFLVIKGFLFF